MAFSMVKSVMLIELCLMNTQSRKIPTMELIDGYGSRHRFPGLCGAMEVQIPRTKSKRSLGLVSYQIHLVGQRQRAEMVKNIHFPMLNLAVFRQELEK